MFDTPGRCLGVILGLVYEGAPVSPCVSVCTFWWDLTSEFCVTDGQAVCLREGGVGSTNSVHICVRFNTRSEINNILLEL